MREEREELPRRRRRTAHDAAPSEPYTVVAVRSLMARPPSPSAKSSRRTPVSRRQPGRPCTAPWSRSCHRSYPRDRCPWPDKSLLRRWDDGCAERPPWSRPCRHRSASTCEAQRRATSSYRRGRRRSASARRPTHLGPRPAAEAWRESSGRSRRSRARWPRIPRLPGALVHNSIEG